MSKRRKGNAMERKGKPEILSPAGNFEVLKAAVYAGADAVYIGGTQFNARMNAKNFDRQTIKEAVEFCHQRGVKLYVTLNTLIYDRQMKDALEFAGFLYKTGFPDEDQYIYYSNKDDKFIKEQIGESNIYNIKIIMDDWYFVQYN